MRKEVFDSLTLSTQAEVIWDFGEYVASRTYYGFRVNLYAMPGFLVEIYYSGYFLSQIETIKILNDQNILSKYVREVELNLD